jgi:hypothetical protein
LIVPTTNRKYEGSAEAGRSIDGDSTSRSNNVAADPDKESRYHYGNADYLWRPAVCIAVVNPC